MKTEDILNEREKTHGDFEQFAELWADLNRVIREHTEKYPRYALESNYPPRTIKHTTSICMMLNKIARIVCGDPNFADHWDDIAGYAMLGRGKDVVIRQEDMPHTPKAGQKFKYEGGEFVPLEGWAYCEKCDGSTQHEDGFCLRESCQKEEAKGAPCKELEEMTRLMQEAAKAKSSKMEHVQEENQKCSDCGKGLYAASEVKLPCIGQEKFLCFRCAGLTFKECAEEKKKEGDERICCVCKKEAETGKLKAYKLCVDCWRTGMINVPRETITGGF